MFWEKNENPSVKFFTLPLFFKTRNLYNVELIISLKE